MNGRESTRKAPGKHQESIESPVWKRLHCNQTESPAWLCFGTNLVKWTAGWISSVGISICRCCNPLRRHHMPSPHTVPDTDVIERKYRPIRQTPGTSKSSTLNHSEVVHDVDTSGAGPPRQADVNLLLCNPTESGGPAVFYRYTFN